MGTVITTIAIIIGLLGILLAWLANRQNKELVGRLERVDERISHLHQAMQTEQQQTEAKKQALQREIEQLKGAPLDMGTTSPLPEPEIPTINEITPEELKTRLDGDEELVVVDMRQLFEYKSGHIPGAINIFVNDIPMQLEHLPKDQDIILQCWAGNTSLQASAFLIENGWAPNRVASLIGGISGWTRAFGAEGLVREE